MEEWGQSMVVCTAWDHLNWLHMLVSMSFVAYAMVRHNMPLWQEYLLYYSMSLPMLGHLLIGVLLHVTCAT
eukprot:820424-Ditylum_brightwellii.AAC.1